MTRVMVFGATGTVGAYTCMYLAERGYEVIAVGHRKSDNGFFAEHGMSYYSVDISNPSDFDVLPVDVECIVHLAGLLPARMKGYFPQKYIDVNLTGSLNILLYAERIGVKSFIYSQSIADVAYLCGSKTPITSDAEPRFPIDNDHTVYSITKTATVNLIKHYAYKCGFKYYILRLPNIYLYHPNPMYYVDGTERWMGYRLMIHKAQRGEPLSVWGNPDKVRDIVYVKDCCQIIERCIATGAESGTYNVGTGIGTTMREQVEGIVKVFSPKSNPSPISYDPSKPDAVEYIFDISKTCKNLGYRPKYNYIDYLEDFKKELEAETFAKLWGTNLDV